MSEDRSAKPLRQHRFKITSKKKTSQSQTKVLGPADVADLAAKPVNGETKTLPQQSAVQAGEGINIKHKRIRSESRPRLLEYPDDTNRGRNQNVGNPSVDPRVEKFTQRRSKSSMDGFYSQNNADRVMQWSMGFNKGAILDAVLQHGFEKTINFTNPRKKLEESIIQVIRGGDTFYDYPSSDEFVVTNTKNIGSIKKQEGEEVKKPIPLNRHRSPTQKPFIGNDADVAKNRTMSEPPKKRGKGADKEMDRESGERVQHDEVSPCSFDDRNEEENDPEESRPHKKSRGKHKKKFSSMQQPFLFSPKANSTSGGSRHSLASDSHGALASIRSPPNSYRIHAKNSSTPKEDGKTKQPTDSESHPNFKVRDSQKSFRKWQPNESTLDEEQGIVDVVSDRRPADSSPRGNKTQPCDTSPKDRSRTDRSPREPRRLSRSPGDTRRLTRSPGDTSLAARTSPRRKNMSPQEKRSQTSVRKMSPQSPPRMSQKSNTCLKTCDRQRASPRGDSYRSDHHKSNVICDSATKKELSCLSVDQKSDLSMSTANRKTRPNSQGRGKGKGKKKGETSPRPYPCLPGFRYRKRCARRLSLNRQNFFGSLAQAVGKELNSIAYRNSLFHSFPGMVGLYRPDIGMDSLFVTPSSNEPSEAEEETDNSVREKKRKKKDDDDMSRLVSSDEKQTSEKEFPKTKEKQTTSKKAGPTKPPSPVKGKKVSDSGGVKKLEIKVYEHPLESKQLRSTATSPHVYEVGHDDYSSSSAEVLTLHADMVKMSSTEVPVQPRLFRKLTGDAMYAPPSEGLFIPERVSEMKERVPDGNLSAASPMSQIKISVSDYRRNSLTPTADSLRQSMKVPETSVPEIRRSTMRIPPREDNRVSIGVKDWEASSPQELMDSGRRSVGDNQESFTPIVSRGDSRMSAKQDELTLGVPMNYKEITFDYNIEEKNEARRKSEGYQDVTRAERNDQTELWKAGDPSIKSSAQERRMAQPVCYRRTSDRYEDPGVNIPCKDDGSSSDSVGQNVSFTNKRHSSLSYQDECVDNVAKRTSLKDSIKEECRQYPECSEQTTDIISSRLPDTNTDTTCQKLPFIANKAGDNIIKQCPILTENLEIVRTESFVSSPTGNSSFVADSTQSKEFEKETCSLYRQDSRSQQESERPSRRTSSAKRSPVKSEQRLISTRHMSQDDCIRPGVEERSSRYQCRSSRDYLMMDSTPKECDLERRKSSKYDEEQCSVIRGDKEKPRDSGHLSDASEDTSTWKQNCSQASVDQAKPCAPSSRRSTKRDSVREKTNKRICDDPPSLVSYDSDKQQSELSIVDNECSCTNADATEDDLTISMPSRDSKQYSHGINHRSSGDEFVNNKEMAGEQKRTCRSRNEERYLQVKRKKECYKHVSDDDVTSSSDDDTYQNDSRLDHDSGANVAAGDMVPQGQIHKIRGRITFRSSHDNKSPIGTKVLSGSVKTSPKEIHYDSCSTDNSEFTETGYIPRKHRSNSISSSKDNMAKYIRDSEYNRERQLRLLEYEQNHTQSCDPGSYNSFVTGNRSPVPAPRSSRKGGYSFDELTSDTADSSESVTYERDLRARQIYKQTIRSQSNMSRLEYKVANVHAKIIDSFVQVITPEQPSGVNDQRSSRSKCDYITQVLRSTDSPYQKPKDKLIPAAQKELQSDATAARTKYLQSKKNAAPSDYNRNKNSPLSKGSASCQHTFLEIKSEFIPYDNDGKPWGSQMLRESYRKKENLARLSVEKKCKSEDVDADNEKSMISSSSAASVVYRQESGLLQGCFIPENETTEYMGSSPDTSTLMTIAKNKNCSSNTERDRNSSSGGGDFLYSDFAYHCGVIDTLRLLDFDNVSSTPSTKLSLADVVDENSDVARKMSFSSVLNAENLAEIARSIPSVGADNQEDKAIELVRQNSIRALLFAASMSNSWTPFRLFPGTSVSSKETAKWVQDLKDAAPEKKESEFFVSSSSQEYIQDCDKRSDEMFDNTLTYDLEPKQSTEQPTFATKPSKHSHDIFSSENSTPVAPKSHKADAQRKRCDSPVDNTTSEVTIDKRKKTTILTDDVGANTETQLVSRKKNKITTRGVKIQVECTRNAAIQTMNLKERVEKCDKSENTEIQYFVGNAEHNTNVSKQSQVERSVDDRHSYSAPDSKEQSSSKSQRKTTKDHQSFKAVKSADRMVENSSVLMDFAKTKHKCSKIEINHSDSSLRKVPKIVPRERSRSLESITIKRRSCLSLERRRNKPCSRSRERDTSPPRGERDKEKDKSYSPNRSNKYVSANYSPSSSPASTDMVEPTSYCRHKSNKQSWYKDYKPATTTMENFLDGDETAQTKVYSIEKSKKVCACSRCQKRRHCLKRYINSRRTRSGGKNKVIVLKTRRFTGACGDVSTNNKTGNNCKRCLSEDSSLLDNIAIFVVASQTTLAENGLKKLSCPEDLSIQPEIIQKVMEKARFTYSNSLDNMHILTLEDLQESSQTTENPTVEDLGQFTSWKSNKNVPWRRNHDSKSKGNSPSKAILESKSTLTITRRRAKANESVSDVENFKRSSRRCSVTKKSRSRCNDSNKGCSSPRRLRGKHGSVARENKSNSSKWDLQSNRWGLQSDKWDLQSDKWDLQSDNVDSDRSVSNDRRTGKHPDHLGKTVSGKRRCDDFLRGELSEEESVPVKSPIPTNVSSFQMTSTSKWKDPYYDATDFQASTGVFNSSGGASHTERGEKTTGWQIPSKGHNSHRFEAQENEKNDGSPSPAVVVSSSVDPSDQMAVQTSPLRFIQSLIDGQVKVLLDKAIQNWTSPMLSKPTIFNQESSSVDSPEIYKVTKKQPGNSSNGSPELVVSAVHPMVNSVSKTKFTNMTESRDQPLVKCTAAASYWQGEDAKTQCHCRDVLKTLGKNKRGNFMSTSGDNEIKVEKSLPEIKSKSSISSKVVSNTEDSYRSVSETDISSTKDHNSSKLRPNKQAACLERSLKKSNGKMTPPQKCKRNRRKAENHAENGKSSRRSSKSPSRSRERASTKSPVAETNVKSAIPDQKRSPTLKSNEVKLSKQNVKSEKHKLISNVDMANKEPEIPKVKSFSECGVSRIANKLIGEVRTDVCSLGVTSSSTEDIKQRILIGCRHFDKAMLERRVMEELMEQKLNGLRAADDAEANMDADSLAGCEGIESCLLTPIMEESWTTHDKSKNDFESFVSECKEKLKDIISKSKGSANDSLSNPINKSHSSSAPKITENPCQAKDDTYVDNSFELKSSSSKAIAAVESLHSGCCGSTSNRNTKENLGLPMQLKGPYKSNFLRNEMSSTAFEGSDPFIKENQMISQYSVKRFYTRHQQSSSSDWLAEKIQEDFNFSKSKFGDLHDSRRNFTANVSTYPSAINYRFSLTESHYNPSYMRKTPRNYSDVSASTSRIYDQRHSSIFSSATSDNCVERAQWFLNEPPRGNKAYMDIAKRNRNESANNGSDSSSSESSGVDDVLNAEDGDRFTGVAKRTNANMYYPSDKSISEKHTKELKNNKDVKQRHRKSSYDGTFCQFHEHNSNSYDMMKTNLPNNVVSTLASRNINGSGNMFGRGNGPADEGRISNHMSLAEQLGDSDEDYTSASEDMMNYSVKMRNKYIRNDGQEMDDTCNHPDAIGYYASNGQSSQLDVFNGAPKEDLLVNMFSADESHPVGISSYRQKADLAERNGAEKKQGCSDIQPGNGHVQQMFKETFSGSRSCFGQGDTSSKKGFTQWYVDDNGEKNVSVVQRRAQATNDAGKYECHEEMCQDDLEDKDDDYDDEDGGVEEDEEEENDVEDDVEDDVESDDSNLERELTHVIGDAPNVDCHKKGDNHEIGDLRHYKEAKNKTDSLEQRAAQNKSYNQSKYKCFDSKTGRINLKNHHHGHRYSSSSRVKHSSGYQKFSLDQIKVPTIEKERVRFACDENGDWAEIGRGSYGCVYLGLLDGIIEVAIKDFYESSSWDLVIHEARMLMFLQDTGITPKFYGLRRRFDVSKQPSEYCIIMEYFGDGRTLFNVMSDKIALTRDAWLDIVGQLVAGLRLIHRKNILINDLKADNILIDLTGGRKIIRYIDVGMATYKQGLTFQLPQDQMSRYNFLAPEVREGARTTTRSDVYSLGYMLEQMCRLADSALGGLKKLVTRCTDKNPSRRPDIDEIVSQVHRFIASKACAPSVASNPQEQFLLTNSV